MWVFWLDAGVKGEGSGGTGVSTNLQIVSREFGMPFESLWTQFALNILFQSKVHNDRCLAPLSRTGYPEGGVFLIPSAAWAVPEGYSIALIGKIACGQIGSITMIGIG